jgi:hypothetical protein
MKGNATKGPSKLSPSERKLYDEMIAEMTARGIDPTPRLPLLMDYVRLAKRIDC